MVILAGSFFFYLAFFTLLFILFFNLLFIYIFKYFIYIFYVLYIYILSKFLSTFFMCFLIYFLPTFTSSVFLDASPKIFFYYVIRFLHPRIFWRHFILHFFFYLSLLLYLTRRFSEILFTLRHELLRLARLTV